MADSIALQVTDEKRRGKLVSCTPKSAKAADDACASQVLGQYGLLLFRRPLTPANSRPHGSGPCHDQVVR
jgi:hypothetical protein